MNTPTTSESAPPRVDKKLIIRLRIFVVISLGLVLYVGRMVWLGDLKIWLALLGIVIGIGIGFPLGRMLTITWHEEDEKAISQLDVVGGIALAAFVALDLSRSWIFGHWLNGPTLTAFSLSILAGALFGRFLGMRISIKRVLAAQDV